MRVGSPSPGRHHNLATRQVKKETYNVKLTPLENCKYKQPVARGCPVLGWSVVDNRLFRDKSLYAWWPEMRPLLQEPVASRGASVFMSSSTLAILSLLYCLDPFNLLPFSPFSSPCPPIQEYFPLPPLCPSLSQRAALIMTNMSNTHSRSF